MDLLVEALQLVLDRSRKAGDQPPAARRSRCPEVEVGQACARTRSTGGGVQRVDLGPLERAVSDSTDAATESGNSRSYSMKRVTGPALGGAAAARMKAWKPPTARSSASALPSRRGTSRSPSSSGAGIGGSATRSMRSTMSAASMRPPATRKARASSFCIVRAVRPQNSALRSLT